MDILDRFSERRNQDPPKQEVLDRISEIKSRINDKLDSMTDSEVANTLGWEPMIPISILKKPKGRTVEELAEAAKVRAIVASALEKSIEDIELRRGMEPETPAEVSEESYLLDTAKVKNEAIADEERVRGIIRTIEQELLEARKAGIDKDDSRRITKPVR